MEKEKEKGGGREREGGQDGERERMILKSLFHCFFTGWNVNKMIETKVTVGVMRRKL